MERDTGRKMWREHEDCTYREHVTGVITVLSELTTHCIIPQGTLSLLGNGSPQTFRCSVSVLQRKAHLVPIILSIIISLK